MRGRPSEGGCDMRAIFAFSYSLLAMSRMSRRACCSPLLRPLRRFHVDQLEERFRTPFAIVTQRSNSVQINSKNNEVLYLCFDQIHVPHIITFTDSVNQHCVSTDSNPRDLYIC